MNLPTFSKKRALIAGAAVALLATPAILVSAGPGSIPSFSAEPTTNQTSVEVVADPVEGQNPVNPASPSAENGQESPDPGPTGGSGGAGVQNSSSNAVEPGNGSESGAGEEETPPPPPPVTVLSRRLEQRMVTPTNWLAVCVYNMSNNTTREIAYPYSRSANGNVAVIPDCPDAP